MGELPDNCLSMFLSFMETTKEIARCSVLSRAFRRAAEHDSLWRRFLPPNLEEIVEMALEPSLKNLPLKQVYLHLCNGVGVTIAPDGETCFSLDQTSGKLFYLMGAKKLYIMGSRKPERWEWKRLPESRFLEVCEMKTNGPLVITGDLRTPLFPLAEETSYLAYFLFKFSDLLEGFKNLIHFQITPTQGADVDDVLDPPTSDVVLNPQPGIMREYGEWKEGWMEVLMGQLLRIGTIEYPCTFEFHVEDDIDEEDGMGVTWQDDIPHIRTGNGLVVLGIQLRPVA